MPVTAPAGISGIRWVRAGAVVEGTVSVLRTRPVAEAGQPGKGREMGDSIPALRQPWFFTALAVEALVSPKTFRLSP